MESKLGNLAQARALFKAGVEADPCNAACWGGWIRMEETANLYSRAEVLRSARDRALESRALPFDFSTMPGADQPGVLQKVRCCMCPFRGTRGLAAAATLPGPAVALRLGQCWSVSAGDVVEAGAAADGDARAEHARAAPRPYATAGAAAGRACRRLGTRFAG